MEYLDLDVDRDVEKDLSSVVAWFDWGTQLYPRYFDETLSSFLDGHDIQSYVMTRKDLFQCLAAIIYDSWSSKKCIDTWNCRRSLFFPGITVAFRRTKLPLAFLKKVCGGHLAKTQPFLCHGWLNSGCVHLTSNVPLQIDSCTMDETTEEYTITGNVEGEPVTITGIRHIFDYIPGTQHLGSAIVYSQWMFWRETHDKLAEFIHWIKDSPVASLATFEIQVFQCIVKDYLVSPHFI
jgi:hypothetical protein